MAGLRIISKYVGDSDLVMIDKVTKTAGGQINQDLEQTASQLAGAIKAGISQAPNPSTESGTQSYLDLKDYAIAGIGVVSEKSQVWKRKKIVPGSKIPVYLVSTSPGGKRSAFANSMIEYGRGRLPGYHPWLRALVNAGGRPNKAYLVKGK